MNTLNKADKAETAKADKAANKAETNFAAARLAMAVGLARTASTAMRAVEAEAFASAVEGLDVEALSLAKEIGRTSSRALSLASEAAKKRK